VTEDPKESQAERQERLARWEERFEAVERRAFENHVLELVRASAPLEEEAYLEVAGREHNPLIRGAELIGEYPDTKIAIRRYDRARDLEQTLQYRIWDDYFRSGEKMREPRWIAGEILTWARGG
jgi:hypothetical protein